MNNPKSRKPLILWCRWHNAVLRLRGKTEAELFGELAFPEGDAEPFSFNMLTWRLTRTSEGEERVAVLDEMGIERQ